MLGLSGDQTCFRLFAVVGFDVRNNFKLFKEFFELTFFEKVIFGSLSPARIFQLVFRTVFKKDDPAVLEPALDLHNQRPEQKINIENNFVRLGTNRVGVEICIDRRDGDVIFADKSTASTRNPFLAKKTAFLPSPMAMSKARPKGSRSTFSRTNGAGSLP